MHFETRAIHAGGDPDDETGAIAPPIHLSTTFTRSPVDGEPEHGYSYIRDHNPTQTRLEEAVAAIESGSSALVFGSGMAAAAAIFESIPPGSHVVLPEDGYYAVRTIASDFFPRWGLTHDFVPMHDAEAVSRAFRENTRAVWCETPSNPLLRIVDLERLIGVAHQRGAIVMVDNTFATPALQRPIELGADIVLHATTKYLGGHSDVQGGSLTFRERGEWYERAEHVRTITGGVASPFNSWMVLRGIRTLSARMRVHCENARAIAAMLARNPKVEKVCYPGLESHEGHDVAKRQMSDFGGMLSFLVKGGRDAALRVTARVRIFTRATSLGGVESLIEHRASSEGPGSRTAPNLLRVSVGLEHKDDLLEDLGQALE
jgi:cystathionine gamma-synthase